jgi:hypothetical protein
MDQNIDLHDSFGFDDPFLGQHTQEDADADFFRLANAINGAGRLEDVEMANNDFAVASRANSAAPSPSPMFLDPPRFDDVGKAAATAATPQGSSHTFPSPQVPQINIDPTLQDPGQAPAVPQVSLAAQVPQVTAPSLFQDPGVAHMPQGFENQDFFGQVNGTNQGLAGQEAFAGNQYGNTACGMPAPPTIVNTAYGMPAPQPPNGMQLGMFSGIQVQQPQFTQGVAYIPGNPYPGIGTSTNQVVPAQGYGMVTNGYQPQFPMPGQLPQVNQFVPPNPPVQVNQPPQPPQPPQPAQPAQPMLHHKRKRRGETDNDPAGCYNRPTGLGSWGRLVGTKNEHVFQYYRSTAELRTGVTYSREDLVHFFLGAGHPNPGRNLTLWIQNTPAQANDRYAHGGDSAKCRFAGCPIKQKTILKGFWRVAFDEFSDISGKIDGVDPMQNAGYMHLHCFETAFDLGYLIHYGAARHGFTIRADTRVFDTETKNPMSITRDHREMLPAYNEWVNGQRARADSIERRNLGLPEHQRYTGFAPPNYEILPHKQRLGYALTAKHLGLQVPGRAKARKERGGNHIERHMGDLTVLNELRRQKRQGSQEPSPDEQQSANEASPSPQTRGKKRSGSADAEASNVKRQKATHSPSSQNVQVHLASQAADTIVVSGPLYHPQAPTYTPRDNLYASLPPRLIQDIANRQDELEEGDIEEMIQAEERDRRRMRLAGLGRFPQRQRQPQLDLLNPVAAGPVTRKRAREAETDDNGQQQQGQGQDQDQHMRKRARQAEADVLGRLSQSPHLTRSAAFNISTRLSQEPPPVQNQVRAALPQPYAELLQQLPAPPEDGDRLAQRIARLDAPQRRAVLQAVGKEETRGEVLGEKKRKVQSL